ncbi:Myosin-3 [Forsythia ovata]|uniref:Myosin-3 n=1 Tax=Forsythia ovata TaxID=205694 RepID=A0ABD1QAX1_9LAMI
MSTTLSSLELMLEKIQLLEDQPKDAPPALPFRPVSRARLPRARKQLPFNFQKTGCEETYGHKDESFKWGVFERQSVDREAFVESIHEQALAESDGIPIGVLENSKEIAQKGILKIQKWYRGHQIRCHYSKLRRGVIALQSFVRGENSRKEHGYRIKRLTAIVVIQKHIREHFVYRALKQRRAAVICLQSGIRGWLSRRHFDHIEHVQKPKIENERGVRNLPKDTDMKDRVLVQHFVLFDLQKQALRMEAKLRKKNEENSSLNIQLQKMEEKWQEHEEKMKSMEKTWQDQLTYIQTCLAEANKNPIDDIIAGKFGQCDDTTTRTGIYHGKSMVNSLDLPSSNGSGPHIISKSTNHVIEQFEGVYDEDGDRARVASDLVKLQYPSVELRKLKLRFTAWKKDFKTRLWEAEATIKKLSHLETEKCQKRWWERQMKKGIWN